MPRSQRHCYPYSVSSICAAYLPVFDYASALKAGYQAEGGANTSLTVADPDTFAERGDRDLTEGVAVLGRRNVRLRSGEHHASRAT